VIFFACFILAMFITLCLIPPLIHIAPRWQFVDTPDPRKVHKNIIPRIGGIAIVVGALIPMLIWLPGNAQTYYLLLAIAVLLFFGAWDDRKDLDFRIKLVGQILAATIVVVLADVRIRWLPFIGEQELQPAIAICFSIFALVGITNALNLVDGLDGLAGGTTLLGFALVGLLAYLAQDEALVIISLGVIGATLGFLRFNTHPASVFMGDSGSQFLGFIAGIMSIRLTQQADVGLSPLFPLVLLGIPIFDTFVVMARRLAQGRSPFSPDRNHIHHRLLDAGLDHYEVVVCIYVLQGFLSVASFTLRYQSDLILSGFLAIFFSMLFTFLNWADKHKGYLKREQKSKSPLVNNSQARQKRNDILTFALKLFLAIALPALILGCSYFSTRKTIDLELLVIGIIVVFSYGIIKLGAEPLQWFERVVLYIFCSLVIFFYYHIPLDAALDKSHLLIIFLILFAFVIIIFQFTSHKGFELSPLDYLVIFITFSLCYYPTQSPQLHSITISVSCLIMLFYIVEFLLVNGIYSPRQLRVGTFLTACCLLGIIILF
jgi:UDP-GlcNAc:undecaprenyl-phosphate/decaprenyl-phosphate GlcNAc-1-phosphate transferase